MMTAQVEGKIKMEDEGIQAGRNEGHSRKSKKVRVGKRTGASDRPFPVGLGSQAS